MADIVPRGQTVRPDPVLPHVYPVLDIARMLTNRIRLGDIEGYLRSREGFGGLSRLGGAVFLAGEQRVDRGIELLAAFEEVQFEDEDVAQQYTS